MYFPWKVVMFAVNGKHVFAKESSYVCYKKRICVLEG